MMARAGRPERRLSASSSSSTSPERELDDDNDSFTMQINDSQSSLALSTTEADAMADSVDEEYARRCREIPVYRLPPEILISVFSRLPSTRDLQSCMLVSKDWAKNSVGLLWHRPSTGHWSSIHSVVRTIRKVNKMFAYQDLVKRLNMSVLGPQVSDGVLLGFAACKRIERLTLTNCTKLTDQSMTPLLDGNRSLVALDVSGMDGFTDVSLNTVAEHCVRLQGLNITQCRKITDDSVINVARNCRHLKRLKFNQCCLLSDRSIMTVASHSTNLLEIDLLDLPLVQSASVTHILESCKQLRELRLMKCANLSDAAFTSLPPKLYHESLRILDLTECHELGDKSVEKIVAACPRLRNLLLAKCRLLTDRAVYAITKLGKNLHYLHLGHCTRLTDESIRALSRHCTRIRYIDLACCTNLTDASITQLASNLPKLKRVGLVKCNGITDRSVLALATYGGRIPLQGRSSSGINVLERIHLSYCTQLTVEGVHALLNNCPRLTHLSLTGVQSFLRDDLTLFCREAPPEFTEHQREVFCVYSGPGVTRLRDHLNKLDRYPSPSPEEEPLDTETNREHWARARPHLIAQGLIRDRAVDGEVNVGPLPPPLRPNQVLLSNLEYEHGNRPAGQPSYIRTERQADEEYDEDVDEEFDADDGLSVAAETDTDERGAHPQRYPDRSARQTYQPAGRIIATGTHGPAQVFRPLPPVPAGGSSSSASGRTEVVVLGGGNADVYTRETPLGLAAADATLVRTREGRPTGE